MTRLRLALTRTFRSLHVRNYRIYFVSQIVSFSGTWMQSVALMWLVLSLTGSGVALGVTTGLQFGPSLLLAPWGGMLADRFDKRRLLMVTQATQGALALALWALVAGDVVELWMVYALSLAHGAVVAVDNPTRQAFASEMVSSEDLSNAVGLNGAIVMAARTVGPAVGGIVIAAAGVATCFLVNAFSYVAVLTGLALMRASELRPAERQPRGRGQLRAALRYVRAVPELRLPLAMMAVVGTLAFNFRVLLPLMATDVFHGGAGTMSLLMAVNGAGTVVGALAAASRRAPTRRTLLLSALSFGCFTIAAAYAPTLELALFFLVPTGISGLIFSSTCNATLQVNSSDEMRGRVMGLYAVVFFGSTPFGAPLVGWIAETLDARAAIAFGGAATLVAALLAGRVRIRRELAATRRRLQAIRTGDDGVAPAQPDDPPAAPERTPAGASRV
ncbi:MAG TPA: MFS transporter [Actinomycetota bacterium]|nr:MFS transporter [Actinomycetota bacterium]